MKKKIVTLITASTLALAHLSVPGVANAAAPTSPHTGTANASYVFTNIATNTAMTMTGNLAGGSVELSNSNPTYQRDIQLQALQNGDVELRSVKTGLCLAATGDNLTTATCGQESARFIGTFYYGRWLMINRLTNKTVTAADTTGANGTKLVLRDRDNQNHQLWYIGAASANRVSVHGRGLTTLGPAFAANTTIRMQAPVTASGTDMRVSFSNRYGAEALTISGVTLAVQSSGAVPKNAPVVATFGGKDSIILQPGEDAYTDPVALPVTTADTVLVSLHLPNAVSRSTYHSGAFATTYIADGANASAALDATPFNRTTTHAYFLQGIDMSSTSTRRTIVAFGDSITDGNNAGIDNNKRWPDRLAARLQANGAPAASVVNSGISSNRVVNDHPDHGGVSGIKRFDEDVVQHDGTTGTIIYLGINDVVNGRSSAEIIAGLENLVTQARNADLYVNIATLGPIGNSWAYSASNEVVRSEVNTWIRANTVGADYVIDVDKALRDPNAPTNILPANDGGDHLHPSAAGMQAIADSIDLTLLKY